MIARVTGYRTVPGIINRQSWPARDRGDVSSSAGAVTPPEASDVFETYELINLNNYL